MIVIVDGIEYTDYWVTFDACVCYITVGIDRCSYKHCLINEDTLILNHDSSDARKVESVQILPDKILVFAALKE